MANWYEDFAKAMDPQPADVATIFAGARAAVPIYALMGSTGLNEGEDEALRKLYGPMPKPSMPPLSEEDEQSRMIADFERQFPTPELRRAALQHMRAVRTNKAYDPSTATRRVDFMPQGTGPEMRSTPPRTRNTDLMRAPPARRAFAGGGSAKKTVQQMADELLMKGTKVADKPDLARRSLFGLKAQPAMDFPLAKIDDKALTRLEKEFGKEGKAPTLTEKTTTVSPDAGATKSTLKSITETPISRRTLLQGAASQAVQGMIPKGLLPAAPVAQAVEAVSKAAAPAAAAMPTTLQGLIARAAKMGLDEDDTIKMLEKMGYDESDVTYMLSPMRNPYDFYEDLGEEAMNPARAMSNLINHDINSPTMSLRGPLREIRRENPDMYDELKQTARDISQYGDE